MSIVNQPDVMYYDRSLSINYFVSSYRIVSLIYFIRQHFLQGVKLNMYFGLIGDPRDGYFHPTFTLMIDSYIPDSFEIEIVIGDLKILLIQEFSILYVKGMNAGFLRQ